MPQVQTSVNFSVRLDSRCVLFHISACVQRSARLRNGCYRVSNSFFLSFFVSFIILCEALHKCRDAFDTSRIAGIKTSSRASRRLCTAERHVPAAFPRTVFHFREESRLRDQMKRSIQLRLTVNARVDRLQQFPIIENRTGPQTIEFLTKRVVALGAVQMGQFLVDCETYISVPQLGKYVLSRFREPAFWLLRAARPVT